MVELRHTEVARTASHPAAASLVRLVESVLKWANSTTKTDPSSWRARQRASEALLNRESRAIDLNRPLALRNDRVGDVFRIQAAVLRYFREYLASQHFTEIVSSKIVGGGTEDGTNLFEIKYFDRVAYLAQSPQFYNEHGVAGLDRVFETGHVYRAEPHATSRHLTEYYSLDLEMGFIDGPEDVIELERELLSFIFGKLNEMYASTLAGYRGTPLPSLERVPIWDFGECVTRLNRMDLVDDLDPEAERELCRLAEAEHGVAAVFVIGFPLSARPFYTHPRTGASQEGSAAGFDLLLNGLEITTRGQRLHVEQIWRRHCGRGGCRRRHSKAI
jgi:nondiscriminating aspartyl-tRNA synthetase